MDGYFWNIRHCISLAFRYDVKSLDVLTNVRRLKAEMCLISVTLFVVERKLNFQEKRNI